MSLRHAHKIFVVGHLSFRVAARYLDLYEEQGRRMAMEAAEKKPVGVIARVQDVQLVDSVEL